MYVQLYELNLKIMEDRYSTGLLKETRVVISKKLKTYTYFWIEDFVCQRYGNVSSKIKSETLSFAGVGGLQDLLFKLNIKQYSKSHTPNKFITNYKLIK